MLGRWVPFLSLIMAMLLWASSFIALKIAFAVYDPMVVIFARMLIAAFCFLFFWRYINYYTYKPGDWKLLGIMVIAEPCLYFVFEANALQNTSATQAGMITSLAPLLVAVAAFYVLQERLRKEVWFGFIIAVSGVVWLSLAGEPDLSAPNPLLGNFLELCAMICATVYTLALKRLSERYSTWLLTALQAFCGSVFFAPFLFLPETSLPQQFNVEGVAAVVYLGTLINIGAYGLYNLGVSKVKAAQASAYINLIPVFTLLMAFFILGERLNFEQFLASGLVLLGVMLSQWQPKDESQSTLVNEGVKV